MPRGQRGKDPGFWGPIYGPCGFFFVPFIPSCSAGHRLCFSPLFYARRLLSDHLSSPASDIFVDDEEQRTPVVGNIIQDGCGIDILSSASTANLQRVLCRSHPTSLLRQQAPFQRFHRQRPHRVRPMITPASHSAHLPQKPGRSPPNGMQNKINCPTQISQEPHVSRDLQSLRP